MKILDVPQSGSLAGQTSSRNRFGQYRRTRAKPVNPASAAQVEARTRLSAFATAWRGLTQAQRDAWNSYAAETSVVDRLGQTIFLTGLQWYVRVNSTIGTVNDLAGSPAIAVRSLPPVGLNPPPGITFALALATAAWTVTMAEALNEETFGLLELSLPKSTGVNFCNDYRTIGLVAPETDDLFAGARANYLARYGNFAVGQRFFWRFTVYGIDGSVGYSITGLADIAA